MEPPNKTTKLAEQESKKPAAFSGIPSYQPMPPVGKGTSLAAKRTFDQISADANKDIERQKLRELLPQVLHIESPSCSAQDFLSRFTPVWQLLDQSHPNRKVELIAWLSWNTFGYHYPNRLPSLASVRTAAIPDLGSVPYSPAMHFLTDSLSKRIDDVDPAAIVPHFETLLAYHPHTPIFYRFFFNLWEKNKGNGHLIGLFTQMALNKWHRAAPEFFERLILLLAKGEFELDFRNSPLYKAHESEKGAKWAQEHCYFNWLKSIIITDKLSVEITKQPLQEPSLTKATLYLRAIEKFDLRNSPSLAAVRMKVIDFLLPTHAHFVLPWLKDKVPSDDPVHEEVINRCPQKDLIRLINFYPTAQVLDRIESQESDLTKLNDWDTELGNIIIPTASRVYRQYLEPHIEDPYVEWISMCPFDVHVYTFLPLMRFINFPKYWSLFRLSDQFDMKDLKEFLIHLAIFWPKLRFAKEQIQCDPEVAIGSIQGTDLLSKLLRYRYFRAPFPELPEELPFDIPGLLARYDSLSNPLFRQQVRQALPFCFTQLLPIINQELFVPYVNPPPAEDPAGLFRDNHVLPALILFRICAKIAQHDKQLPDDIIAPFNQLVAAMCPLFKDDLREPFIFLTTMEQLQNLVPKFFSSSNIGPHVELIRKKVNEVVYPVSKLE